MKKLFLSSIALFVFSISILVFQMSCRKSVVAQTVTSSVTPIGIVLIEGQNPLATNIDSTHYYYTANYDGSNLKQINLSGLPSGTIIVPETGRLSPDGKTLFFIGGAGVRYLYSINTNGTNLKQLFPMPTNAPNDVGLDGAY
jgi:hypothetical protein